MTEEPNDDYHDRIAPELRALDAPPPLPADSIWRGIEAGLAGARERERTAPARRRVHLSIAGAIAASLALLATGAAVGYGMSAQPAAESASARSEGIDESETPTEAIPGDTVQVAWF